MAFLPPFSGVFRLSLSGSWPGIPCRRLFDFQGSMKACRKHITIKQVFLGRIRSGFEGENRTWEVRFLWTALDRAYHKIARFFRKWYFRFLPSKPEVIVPVLCNIEWINDDFFGNDFFYKKFAYSASVKIRSRHSLCAEYRVLAKPNNRFWSRICKIRFKNRELVPTRPTYCGCKCENFCAEK